MSDETKLCDVIQEFLDEKKDEKDNYCVNLAFEPYFNFKCSRCGIKIDDYTAFHDKTAAFGRRFEYCPICGRKVINT